MNKDHIYTIPFAVNYQFNENTVNREILPDHVDLNVTATGWKLLMALSVKHSIDIPAPNAETASFIASQNSSLFERKLPQYIGINKIYPDTILFDLDKKVQKKIPVRLNADFSFSPGYNYADDVQIVPDSITIEGPESRVQQYQEWRTEKVSKRKISKNFTGTAPLLYDEKENIKLSAIIVEYKVKVAQFEKNHLVISLKNLLPETYTVQPENIVIYYTRPRFMTAETDSSSFLYSVDFSKPSPGIQLLDIKPADSGMKIDSIIGQRINIQVR